MHTLLLLCHCGWVRSQQELRGCPTEGGACAGNLFEEVEPSVIFKDRKNENGTRDFLVKWADGEEDSWVSHVNNGVSTSKLKALSCAPQISVHTCNEHSS